MRHVAPYSNSDVTGCLKLFQKRYPWFALHDHTQRPRSTSGSGEGTLGGQDRSRQPGSVVRTSPCMLYACVLENTTLVQLYCNLIYCETTSELTRVELDELWVPAASSSQGLRINLIARAHARKVPLRQNAPHARRACVTIASDAQSLTGSSPRLTQASPRTLDLSSTRPM